MFDWTPWTHWCTCKVMSPNMSFISAVKYTAQCIWPGETNCEVSWPDQYRLESNLTTSTVAVLYHVLFRFISHGTLKWLFHAIQKTLHPCPAGPEGKPGAFFDCVLVCHLDNDLQSSFMLRSVNMLCIKVVSKDVKVLFFKAVLLDDSCCGDPDSLLVYFVSLEDVSLFPHSRGLISSKHTRLFLFVHSEISHSNTTSQWQSSVLRIVLHFLSLMSSSVQRVLHGCQRFSEY